MKLLQIAYGAATLIPGFTSFRVAGTGGTDSARYCYSVWLRHLVKANAHGLDPDPETVAELGPGDSLGIGLAALICGASKYLAFDVVRYASADSNLRVFDQLVELFHRKTDIPAQDEFPLVKPDLDDYRFPGDILDTARMKRALDGTRLERIRSAIANTDRPDSPIAYRVPWLDPQVIDPHGVDMICSQAVLEHVDDLAQTYRAMRLWLKPSGYVSHQIDFKSHGTTARWNGHWATSDLVWTIARGKRPYLLNRQPHSAHLSLLAQEGFRVVCDQTVRTRSTLARHQLAPRFQSLTDEDLLTSGAFIQATGQ